MPKMQQGSKDVNIFGTLNEQNRKAAEDTCH